MTLMVTGEIVANRVLAKTAVVVTEVIVEVAANNIAIYAGSAVALARQLEMVTGWNFLWNRIRDLNELSGNAGAIVYSGTDINKKGHFDHRFGALIAGFTPTDIIVGVGASAASEYHDAVTILDSGLEQLIQVARESIVLKAA